MQDYYKILEVDYDATDEMIRLNYLKLALVSGASTMSSFLCELLQFLIAVVSSLITVGLIQDIS